MTLSSSLWDNVVENFTTRFSVLSFNCGQPSLCCIKEHSCFTQEQLYKDQGNFSFLWSWNISVFFFLCVEANNTSKCTGPCQFCTCLVRCPGRGCDVHKGSASQVWTGQGQEEVRNTPWFCKHVSMNPTDNNMETIRHRAQHNKGILTWEKSRSVSEGIVQC